MPTSALDSLTESFVTQNMTCLFQGKTVVVVAHRLQIVVLSEFSALKSSRNPSTAFDSFIRASVCVGRKN
jgi:hypothetical protein